MEGGPPPGRTQARGPFFDELRRGQRFAGAPGLTLTSGVAAVHQAVLGDRLALATDHELARAVAGRPLAHPAVVWDVAIGQSTLATHFVRANLFYRGLVFRRFPGLGDTLSTSTEVVGLRQNAAREGRPRTGLAALRVTTHDQHGRPVLDFHRCAMLPLAPDAEDTGHGDDLSGVGAGPAALTGALTGLDLAALPAGPAPPPVGQVVEVVGGDVVTGAPELARLTLNVAQVHHDARAAGGRRLVYGGHTIGLAAAQVTRALPGVLAFLGWESCDHLGPVHEGDTVRSTLTVESVRGLEGTGRQLVGLRSEVTADPPESGEVTPAAPAAPRPVLDWRFAVLV